MAFEWQSINLIVIVMDFSLVFKPFVTCRKCFSVSLARPQLASSTEIPAEAKATTVFLSATSTTSMIKDSIPKLEIKFLNNHCSDFDKILYLNTLCVEPQHNSCSGTNEINFLNNHCSDFDKI